MNLNVLEALGINLILTVLRTVVKNPAHMAALQDQLLNVADDIYVAYGVVPPARPAK